MNSFLSDKSKSGRNKALCLEANVVEVSNCIDISYPSSDIIITIPACTDYFKVTVELKSDCLTCPKCVCGTIKKTFCISDLVCIENLCIYHTSIQCARTHLENRIIAKYNIIIKYTDCEGNIKTVTLSYKIIFRDLPSNISKDSLTLLFKNILCNYDSCGVVTVCFTAKLCFKIEK